MKTLYSCFLLFLIFSGCSKKEPAKQPAAITPTDSTDSNKSMVKGEWQCVFQKGIATRKNTFPFNKSDRIELVSYKTRDVYSPDSLILEGKFTVGGIQERVTLNSIQTDSLFSILYNYKIKRKGDDTSFALCYDPHHAIIFYKGVVAIAYFEVCFSCRGTLVTKGIDGIEFCEDKWCMLQNHFKANGIKFGYYYGFHCPEP